MAEKTVYDNINKGKRLAEGKWRPLIGNKFLEASPIRAAQTALVLENTVRFQKALLEDTNIPNVGVFDKFTLPIIRAVFPNLIAQDIVSVQPMDGPTGLVFFSETRYSDTKGSASKGDTNLSVISGHNSQYRYSSELVDAEHIGTGDGSDTTPTLTDLGGPDGKWRPIRPYSVSVTVADSNVIAVDDGLGNMVGTGIAAGTVNYATGAIALTYSVAPANTKKIYAAYKYNSEGNTNIPGLELMISSAPIQAEPNKLRIRYSLEAMQDLRAVHNMDAEAELLAHASEELRFELDRMVIQDLYSISATNGIAAWSKTPAAGVSYYEHQLTFVNTLIAASNAIFAKTKRVYPNWLVCGIGMSNVIEALPNFRPAQVSGSGVVHMGTLAGRWEVYKDPWFPTDEGMLGYKGNGLLDAGYAFCPYVPLYRTPTVYLDDMVGRVGFMSRNGRRTINPFLYGSVSVTS